MSAECGLKRCARESGGEHRTTRKYKRLLLRCECDTTGAGSIQARDTVVHFHAVATLGVAHMEAQRSAIGAFPGIDDEVRADWAAVLVGGIGQRPLNGMRAAAS